MPVQFQCEEIYLFVNPILREKEGVVHRLEKEIRVEELMEKELAFEGI